MIHPREVNGFHTNSKDLRLLNSHHNDHTGVRAQLYNLVPCCITTCYKVHVRWVIRGTERVLKTMYV